MSAIHQLQPGRGTTTREALGGVAVSARTGAGSRWRHPWTISPSWQPGTRRWVAVVKPGFVNGEAPIVRTTTGEQADNGRDFGINPLTGEKYFSAAIFTEGTTERETSRRIDIPIYLSPALNLSFRPLGFDGPPIGNQVPEFFRDRGVADAPEFDFDLGVSGDTTRPKDLRLLRACDLVLHQPRLALTSQVTLAPGPATGISNVTQTLGLRSAAPGDTLSIFAGNFAPPNASFDPLTFDYDEANYDELLIGTVFLLSPPGLALGAEPDGTWQPFVRHALFWNLNYQPGFLRPLATDPGIPFIPPLAAGAAQLVINFLTASLNDATQQALNILQSHTMAGTWWTPTGGGSTAEFPPEEEIAAPTGTGLNHAATVQARRQARAQRRQSAALDPAFPYRAVPFTTSLLSAA